MRKTNYEKCVCFPVLISSAHVHVLPPQALAAVQMEGVLWTAGMKAGCRSNRSLLRLGMLEGRERKKINERVNVIKVSLLLYQRIFKEDC